MNIPHNQQVSVTSIKEERDKLEKEFARLNRSYEFHLSFALQAVAFFYAAVGAVLSIFFGGNGGLNKQSKVAITVLLVIPILMSFILGCYLFYGARLQHEDAKYMRRIAEELKIERRPKVELLTELLYAFSVLFFITLIGLVALLITVLG
jgi:hypothetical protein